MFCGLKKKLISIGQLDNSGHSILFFLGMWKVSKRAMVLACGKKTDTLYMTTRFADIIVSIEAENQAQLWHCRLGHMSQKGMKILQSKGKLPKSKNVDLDICESCIPGKQKKLSFLKVGKTL